MYLAPRKVIGSLDGIEIVEMPRNGTKGMCCGAGGARMWMEETIGKKVNDERAEEALATGATRIATACPFCYIMIDDGVKGEGQGRGGQGPGHRRDPLGSHRSRGARRASGNSEVLHRHLAATGSAPDRERGRRREPAPTEHAFATRRVLRRRDPRPRFMVRAARRELELALPRDLARRRRSRGRATSRSRAKSPFRPSFYDAFRPIGYPFLLWIIGAARS